MLVIKAESHKMLVGIANILVETCKHPEYALIENTENSHIGGVKFLGDTRIYNFYLGRYTAGYTVGNLVLW